MAFLSCVAGLWETVRARKNAHLLQYDRFMGGIGELLKMLSEKSQTMNE
jgi:hypothetical protein